ncbi:hypothetical protein EVAR_43713_1 [Eumeta japonica]|uniref:Pentatricopeptide repeat-containing protein 1, mitochondrial n=1 Tax=Eumeta variegata TaxID=151549 RepID=A0A4C1WX32_EUMVA|nr:hypothetical protein EVAR_43713_1 [Eumeta japonica]
MIEDENKLRKKKYPLKKKLKLKPNVMTYGVLAMACDTKVRAEELLMEMKEQGLKANAEIMGALLRQATCHNNLEYILFVMNTVKEEKLRIGNMFMKHLINFNEKCKCILSSSDDGKQKCKKGFARMHSIYERAYLKWLKEVDIEESLKEEHPWKQFMHEQPEIIQRQSLIKEPKRFCKRKLKFVLPYRP